MLALTAAGRAVLLRALGGETLNFTNIRLGDGTDAGAATEEGGYASASALSHVRNTMEITGSSVGDAAVVITASFSNAGVTTGYRATELGVYVEDPDDSSAEILYAYEYTAPEAAQYIPAYNASEPMETTIDCAIYVGEAQSVNVYISEQAGVTPAQFNAHTGDHSNPHQVTAEQIGLGNVENVAVNDMAPTFSEAAALAEPASGETASTLWGKMKKAVASLIAHIGATGSNVHGETPSSIGAAAATHTHSASDINTGILGEARGGTGLSSIALLLETLLTAVNYSASLDDLTTPGIYRIPQENNPFMFGGATCIVIRQGSNITRQILLVNMNLAVYFRDTSHYEAPDTYTWDDWRMTETEEAR